MNIEKGYINVQAWMLKELDLKPLEALVYALIYGSSQGNHSKFTGSLKYIQDLLNISRSTAMRTIQALIDKGLIIKESEVKNGVSFNSYRVDMGGIKMTPNNI